MRNPGLPKDLWAVLDGRLWHATDAQGLAGIVASGAVQVSDTNRYKNSFCRQREFVSLFDFGSTASDQSDFEASNWHGWLGTKHVGRYAIWLDIDR